MTQGPIWKHLLTFGVSMGLGLLFQQLYNTVDTIVVGQFVGKEALAAVGSTASIINTLVGFAAGLSTGASVVIAQCYGAHNHRDLHDAVHTTIAVTFILSVMFTFLGIFLVEPLLHLMAMPEDVFASAKTYLTIYYSGMIGLLFYNVGAAILRAVGDSTRPLYFLCFSAALNTALDLLFVIVFKLGVAGVGYATIIAQAISAVLVMITLTHEHHAYGVRWKDVRIHRRMLSRIVSIGLPSGIQQAITSFSNVFVQSYVNAFGSACMAGWSSYNKLDAFLFLPPQAISMAATTFVGQNFGAKQLDRAHKGVHVSLGISSSVTFTLLIIVMIFAPQLILLFTSEPEVIEYGVHFIRHISPFYLLTCINQTYGCALRGLGISKLPTFIFLGSFVAFRQLYLFTGKMLFGSSLPWVTMAYPMGWILSSTLLLIMYYRIHKRMVQEAAA